MLTTGEACMKGVVPGWRQALEALVCCEEPLVNAATGDRKAESNAFDEAVAGDKVRLQATR